MSSRAHDQRLMCSDKGALSGCKNRLSWEKWRLIDAGGGHWFLESNEHRGKFLSSDKEGNVFTTGNKLSWEKWAIERFIHFFLDFSLDLFLILCTLQKVCMDQ